MALIKARTNMATSGPAPVGDGDHRLDHDDAHERRAALRDIAMLPPAEADLRIPTLATRLRLEQDAATQELLFTTLVRLGTPAAASILAPLLRLEDVKLRNAAIEALRQMPSDAVGLQIAPLLQDPDPDVRIFTVQLIGRVDHPDRTRWLTDILLTEPEKNVCMAAVEALAEHFDPALSGPLQALPARFDNDPFVGFSVISVLALHRFGGV